MSMRVCPVCNRPYQTQWNPCRCEEISPYKNCNDPHFFEYLKEKDDAEKLEKPIRYLNETNSRTG